MSGAETKFQFSAWRLTYGFVALSIVAGLSSYGWYLYALVRDSQRQKPQPQIEKLRRDFRAYYAQTRQFPDSFVDINQRLWHTAPPPDYGREGRQAHTKNYYYWYTKVSAETCAFWALPTGPQRQYASSYFVVLSPHWVRVWQGAAKSDDEIARLPAIPSLAALAEMRMQELPGRTLNPNPPVVP